MDKFLELRKSIIQITQALSARGFFGTEFGTAGNVSARFEKQELVGVTPSSHAYQDLKPEDICIIDFDQNLVSGELVPSLEASMHLSTGKEIALLPREILNLFQELRKAKASPSS